MFLPGLLQQYLLATWLLLTPEQDSQYDPFNMNHILAQSFIILREEDGVLAVTSKPSMILPLANYHPLPQCTLVTMAPKLY